MKLKFLLLSLFIFPLLSIMNGQTAPARYGKIDVADLEMKVYAPDTISYQLPATIF